MIRNEKNSKLNLNTLEFEGGRPDKKKKRSKIEEGKSFSSIILIAVFLLVIIGILFFVFFRKKNPKYIVKDFYNLAKVDVSDAKRKYNERNKHNEEVNEILSSRFKYDILEVKDISSEKQKKEKVKIVEMRLKLYNVDKRKVRTEASENISKDLTIGTDEYNKEYLKNLKNAVKKAELQNKETKIKLKYEKGEWYIIDYPSTDLI